MKNLIIQITNLIPNGKVASYGDVANQINNINMINGHKEKTNGRIVGKVLSNMPECDRNQLPRHRIINTKGFISSLKLGKKGILQIQLLRQEGIEISDDGYLDITRCRFTNRAI